MNATRRVISTDTANSPSVAFTAALLRLAANIVADSKDMVVTSGRDLTANAECCLCSAAK